MASSSPDLRRRGRGSMAVGARLRSKAARGLPRRGPRGRARTDGDEEAAALLEQPERGDQAASWANAGRPGARSARKVHLAVLPERYEPLEEQAPGEKPKRRYRQKLKKYGKVGPRLPDGSKDRRGRGGGLGPPPRPLASVATRASESVPPLGWEVRVKSQVMTQAKPELSGSTDPSAPPGLAGW